MLPLPATRNRRGSPVRRLRPPVRTAIAVVCAVFAALVVTPARAATPHLAPSVTAPAPIFTIGTRDQSDKEFALAPGDYPDYVKTFPKDVNYTVGASDPAKDWSFVQPSVSDPWAGSKTHPFTISYTLTKEQAAGDLLLRISYMDTHDGGPPKVQVSSNGTDAGTVATPAGGGSGALGLGTAQGTTYLDNHPHQIGFVLPKTTLKEGANSLVITNTTGSWSVYDAVSLTPVPSPAGAVQILADNPTVLIKNETVDNKPVERQLVDLQVNNTGAQQDMTFTATADGRQAKTTLSVPAGPSTQRIEVPPAPSSGAVELGITAGSGGAYTTRLPYQKRWQLDVMNGSHLDIGYRYDQSRTRQRSDEYLDSAVAECTRTKDYPAASRFRWTIEHAWMVDSYLEDRSAAKVNDLKACLQSGQLELTALYDNNLDDLAGTEQLTRSLYKGTDTLPKRLGLTGSNHPVTTAIQDDVTGVTAQHIQMLAQQGVKLLINGSNPFHTNRLKSPHTSQDTPALFTWQAPDGSKVLTLFDAGVYPQGYIWSSGLDSLSPWPDGLKGAYQPPAPPDQATVTNVLNSLVGGVVQHTPGLQVSDYPQSVYPLMVFNDSHPPLVGLADVMKSYNQTYAWPKLVTSTPSSYYADATTRQGQTSPSGYQPDPTSKDVSALPVKHGDYTGWWSDGAGSSALETGENMESQSRTTSAETLGSLAGLKSSDAARQCLLEAAYQDEELYTEHTWGGPSLANNDPQWPIKKAFADKADRFSRQAMASATGDLAAQVTNTAKNPGIAVFNSLSWKRTDVVTATVPSGTPSPFAVTDEATGKSIPFDPIKDNSGKITAVRFIATDVPAVGYRSYSLTPAGAANATATGAPSWDPAHKVLQNQYYKVTFNDSGTISSIINKATGRELVDSSSSFKLNQYVYRPGTREGQTSAAHQWSPTAGTVSLDSSGPVSATIKVTYPDTTGGKDAGGAATGVQSAGATVTLYAGLPRIDIGDTIDKTLETTTAEEGYFAFPFKKDNPTVTYETPGAPVQLVDGQMPGSAMDWQSVRGYADISAKDSGVTLSTTNAPLMEFDHIRSLELQSRPGFLDNRKDPSPDGVRPKNGSVFSYAFNNLWATNYRKAQSGPITYNYSITDHTGGFMPVAATQYGTGVQTPLQTAPLPAAHNGTYAAGAHSLASLDTDNTVVQTIKQAYPVQSTASPSPSYPLTVRLLEVAGKNSTTHLHLPVKIDKATLENLTEEPTGTALTVTDSGTGSDITLHVKAHQILTVGLHPAAAYNAGTPLVCATEFGLAPADYTHYSTAFPHDVDYTAQQDPGFTTGVSYPTSTTPWTADQGTSVAPQWSYVQPGPADSWAGSKQHTFTLRFNLNDNPASDLKLALWLLDTREVNPPTIKVALGGGTGQSVQLPAGGGDGIHWGDGQPNTANGIKPTTQTFALPHGQLRKGPNTITITTTAGSWLTYDGFAITAPTGTS